MPKVIHDALLREANSKGLKGPSKDAYIYGTLSKIEARSGKTRSKRINRFTQRGR